MDTTSLKTVKQQIYISCACFHVFRHCMVNYIFATEVRGLSPTGFPGRGVARNLALEVSNQIKSKRQDYGDVSARNTTKASDNTQTLKN